MKSLYLYDYRLWDDGVSTINRLADYDTMNNLHLNDYRLWDDEYSTFNRLHIVRRLILYIQSATDCCRPESGGGGGGVVCCRPESGEGKRGRWLTTEDVHLHYSGVCCRQAARGVHDVDRLWDNRGRTFRFLRLQHRTAAGAQCQWPPSSLHPVLDHQLCTPNGQSRAGVPYVQLTTWSVDWVNADNHVVIVVVCTVNYIYRFFVSYNKLDHLGRK